MDDDGCWSFGWVHLYDVINNVATREFDRLSFFLAVDS